MEKRKEEALPGSPIIRVRWFNLRETEKNGSEGRQSDSALKVGAGKSVEAS